jgi:hypothetical protein
MAVRFFACHPKRGRAKFTPASDYFYLTLSENNGRPPPVSNLLDSAANYARARSFLIRADLCETRISSCAAAGAPIEIALYQIINGPAEQKKLFFNLWRERV